MDVPPTDPRRSRGFRLVRLAIALLVAGLVANLGLFLTGAVLGIQVPDLLEYGEPYIVSAAWNAGSGGSLYAPVDDLPFLHNNYNPLAQLLVAPVLARVGPSYVPLRALTALSACALLLVLYAVVRRETGSRVAGLVAALLPLGCTFVFPWLCLGRVDVFATLFSALGVAFAFLRRDAPRWQRAVFLLFAWIAFAAKQTVIGGAAAVLLFDLVRGRWRDAFLLGSLFAAGCAAIVLAANLASSGQHWLHAVVYNASHERGGFWPQGLPPAELFWAIGPVLLLLAVLTLPFARWSREGPWICWLAISFPLAFALLRKSGSHVHYLLESVGALSVLATLIAARLVAAARAARRERLLGAMALASLLVAAALVPVAWKEHWQQVKRFRWLIERPDPVPAEVRERIATGAAPSLLLAKLGSLSVEAGRPAIFDVADFVRLQELGLWDPADRLLPLVEARYFPVIGLARFPAGHPARQHFDAARIRGLEEAVARHYRPLAQELEDPKSRQSGQFWVPKEDR